MHPIMTFAEYLALRSAQGPSEQDRGRAPVAERSLMRGVFRAVNPARPVSPTSSRLLAGPFPRKFKSQVIGR
jgi:hypothetical protein